MKKICYFLLTFLLCCSCKQRLVISENDLITDIVIETIKQDSLNTSRSISSYLINYYLYTKDSTYGYLPPPPMSRKGKPFVFDTYRKDMYSSLDYVLKPEDSAYIVKQVSLLKNIKLDSARITSEIKIVNVGWNTPDQRGENIFYFMIPIFNKDKTFVRVEYFYQCVSCGYGKMLFFRKIENKWYKVESYVTWRT